MLLDDAAIKYKVNQDRFRGKKRGLDQDCPDNKNTILSPTYLSLILFYSNCLKMFVSAWSVVDWVQHSKSWLLRWKKRWKWVRWRSGDQMKGEDSSKDSGEAFPVALHDICSCDEAGLFYRKLPKLTFEVNKRTVAYTTQDRCEQSARKGAKTSDINCSIIESKEVSIWEAKYKPLLVMIQYFFCFKSFFRVLRHSLALKKETIISSVWDSASLFSWFFSCLLPSGTKSSLSIPLYVGSVMFIATYSANIVLPTPSFSRSTLSCGSISDFCDCSLSCSLLAAFMIWHFFRKTLLYD